MQLRGTNIVVDTVAAKTPVISGSGATRTLNELESGSTVLFDRAAGIVYTLPIAKPGIHFDFVTTQSITTNFAKVIADISTNSPVIIGNMTQVTDTGASPVTFIANGSTHIAIASNGTTTGAQVGSRFRIVALSAGTWFVTGLMRGTGTFATPFATS